jgi:hypothetical protein
MLSMTATIGTGISGGGVQSTTTEHVTDITADVSTSTFTRHDAGTYSGGNYNLSSYCLDYQSSDHYHNEESGTATCSY